MKNKAEDTGNPSALANDAESEAMAFCFMVIMGAFFILIIGVMSLVVVHQMPKRWDDGLRVSNSHTLLGAMNSQKEKEQGAAALHMARVEGYSSDRARLARVWVRDLAQCRQAFTDTTKATVEVRGYLNSWLFSCFKLIKTCS